MSQATNLDIMQIMDVPEYDILYTDPPWGNRMVKFFETMERKMTGNSHNNNLMLIIRKLGKIADPTKPLIVEYSVAGWQEIVEWLKDEGHSFYKKFDATQSMNRPYVLLVFNANFEIDTTLKGFKVVTDTVTRLGAKRVFDPFGGIGLTAKAVHRAGAEYYGNEINSERYKRLNDVCVNKKS